MGGPDASESEDDAVDEDLGRELARDDSDLVTLVGHFYRGEMDRTTAWRNRLDRTTYWAVTVMVAVLTWVFSNPDNPHYILLIGMLTLVVFLFIESRRYRAYDVWRSRLRLLEENVFAETLDPRVSVDHEEWREMLSEDLREQALKVSFAEAFSRRLRRVYYPLLLVLLVAWLVRTTLFASGQTWLATAAVVGVPGWLVVVGVALFYLTATAVAFWPRTRQAKGEFHDRETGQWKE